MLNKIRNKKIKNIVRGVLHAHNNDELKRTLKHLRTVASVNDTYYAYDYMYDNPIGKNSPIPAAFPDNPSSFDKHIYFEPITFVRELSYHRVSFERNLPKLHEAMKCLKNINVAIFQGDVETIKEELAAFSKKFGYSLIFLKKLVATKHLAFEDSDLTTIIQSNIREYLHPKRNIAVRAYEDSIDSNTDYVNVRRAFLSYIKDDLIKGFADKRTLENYFDPTILTSQTAAERLQGLSCFSCLDSLMFLLSNRKQFVSILSSKEYVAYQNAIPASLIKYFNDEFESISIGNINQRLDTSAKFQEYYFFRQSSNFDDVPAVLNYRLTIEKIMGRRLGCLTPNLNVDLDSLAIKLEPVPIADFWNVDCGDDLDIAHIDPKVCGTFHRTTYLMWMIEKKMPIDVLTGVQFLKLMDITVDVAKVLTVSEIIKYFPNPSKDMLHACLTSALINDATNTDTSGHKLRKELQILLKAEHDGSILKFVEYLQTHASHVARYFFQVCSEPFLTKLYGIYKHSSDIIEGRCGLLEWYAATYDDQDAYNRAQSLRLDLKLQAVRGDIDDNRIIVDQARFFIWMSEKVLSELRDVSATMTQEKDYKISSEGDVKNPVNVIQNPELKLKSIINQCFQEFCTNKNYGVESYIGRRIRHGSIDGMMLADISELIKNLKNNNNYDQAFSAKLDDWMVEYREVVKNIGNNLLRVHHHKLQKKGRIVPSVQTALKKNILSNCINDVADDLKKDDLSTALERIYEYCWMFLEVDLTVLREEIVQLRSNLIMEKYTRDEAKSRCSREINIATQEKFDRLNVWLQKPNNVSPTTSLSLLFKAVIAEIKEQHPDFEPEISMHGDIDINLYGHGYHFFYDILEILVKNIAQHGKKKGKVLFSFETDDTGTDILKVTSEITNNAGLAEKINELFKSDISNAMSESKNSGVKKLLVLKRDIKEIKSVGYEHGQNTLTAVITMQINRV